MIDKQLCEEISYVYRDIKKGEEKELLRVILGFMPMRFKRSKGMIFKVVLPRLLVMINALLVMVY